MKRTISPADFPEVSVQIVRNRYVKGGEVCPEVAVLPLGILLHEPWKADVHFMQYSSASGMRLRKEHNNADSTFATMTFDLDFCAHEVKPTAQSFMSLITAAESSQYPPNAAYATRGGARLVYLIDPITNRGEFECKRFHLHRLLTSIIPDDLGYIIDPATNDWTRLFRAPRIIRGGVREHDNEVWHFHDSILSHSAWAMPKAESQRKRITKPAKRNLNGVPFKVLMKLCAIQHAHPGSGRTTALLAAVCCINVMIGDPESRRKLVSTALGYAADNGLDRASAERALRSASAYAESVDDDYLDLLI